MINIVCSCPFDLEETEKQDLALMCHIKSG